MGNTYTQIYLHFVFAVQNRQSLIGRSIRDDVYRYIAGIVNNRNQTVIAVGGMPDHVHLLCGIRAPFSISDFMRDIKGNSSAWINENRLVRGHFHWQRGFGGFSYGRSQLDRIANYIRGQELHHRRRSFKEEFLELLRRFEIDHDPDYLFTWIDRDPIDSADYALPAIQAPTEEEIVRYG